MILRKPYKFLIKHFKLIHLIITLLMTYIIYRFIRIMNFFDLASSSYTGILSTNPTASLFDLFIYLAIFSVIILIIVLIYLLFMKNKPIKLYISTIVVYVVSFLLLAYAYNVIGNMEVKVVDVKVLRNTRDFFTIISLIQAIQIVLYGIRSFGLDIKNFNFKEDLKDLEITDIDNEEFEFDVNVDVNVVNRNVNKGKRYLKYFYVENRYLFFFISSISICVICLITYLSLGVYNKKYTQTDYFAAQDFTLAITNSYITNLDYDEKVISNNKSFVILEINIRTNGNRNLQLNLANFELIVGYNKYYHSSQYKDKFVDIGTVYNGQIIDNNFTKYLIVYPIDKDDINKAMTFRYVDNTSFTSTEAKTINVGISTRNLDKLKDTKSYNFGDTIDFGDSILDKTKLVINNQTISDTFQLNYQFCLSGNECYQSREYLKPSIINNYDKTLLKLNGQVLVGDEDDVKTTNLFNFIKMYGYFTYKINGVEKTDNTILKNVKSIRVNEKDTYYLEVLKEIENAEELYLNLKVRDYIYIYRLK